MRKINYRIAFVFLALISLCVFFAKHNESIEVLHGRVNDCVVKKLKKENQLYAAGFGWDMDSGKLKVSTLDFKHYNEATLEEGRALIVKAVKTYLSEINRNEKFQKYLHSTPFTENNINLCIFFYKPNGSEVSLGQISCITLEKGGMLTYSIYNPAKPDYVMEYWIEIHRESFAEAVSLTSGATQKSPKIDRSLIRR